ncbi:SDR family oxidoreductase [Streptomyces sp. enrichment culture]|uniref:SDR family oxidoreductase n=1 Tax=Streptomyces sp. enrichment culture TaxID=1795815 RepID=UPI003F55D71E
MSAYADQRVLVVGGTSGVGLVTAHEFAAGRRHRHRLPQPRAAPGGPHPAVRAPRPGDRPAPGHPLRRRSGEVRRLRAGVRPRRRHRGRDSHGAGRRPAAGRRVRRDGQQVLGAYRIARSVPVRSSGSLILVAGYLSRRPGRASALQSAVNAALEALVRGLALEYAPLRVNAVSPGLLRTPLWDGPDAAAREDMYEAAVRRLPVGRVGEADDIAQAVLFLAANAYTTGSTLYVDGGGMIA